MKELDRIDGPCIIHRTDNDQFMKYGEPIIIFKDSDQALAFANNFPMFFEDVDAEICEVTDEMTNDKEHTVWYDDIADKMKKEKEYQLARIKETEDMKGKLKDE